MSGSTGRSRPVVAAVGATTTEDGPSKEPDHFESARRTWINIHPRPGHPLGDLVLSNPNLPTAADHPTWGPPTPTAWVLLTPVDRHRVRNCYPRVTRHPRVFRFGTPPDVGGVA